MNTQDIVDKIVVLKGELAAISDALDDIQRDIRSAQFAQAEIDLTVPREPVRDTSRRRKLSALINRMIVGQTVCLDLPNERELHLVQTTIYRAACDLWGAGSAKTWSEGLTLKMVRIK